MAKHNSLTARRVETAPAGKYADGRGSGLWLIVTPTGARRWFVRVVVNGKRREMSLGSFPLVSLSEARDKAFEAQRLAKRGIDPIAQRNTNAPTMPVFTTVAATYIRAHRRSWRNPKHARQWVATLKNYARPTLGRLPVDTITTESILAVLEPIWNTKNETAKRVQGRLENIFDYAGARKWCTQPNPARWRGHLDKLLAKPVRVKTVRHHPAMPYQQVPQFMHALTDVSGVSALALRFLILTATRTSETLNATWEEIDLDRATWTIPKTRMKAHREHRIPLSDGALAVLRAVPRLISESWLFPSVVSGRPLSSMALLSTMRKLGYGVHGTRGACVPHGFRSSFRDWCGEESNFPTNVAEAALAHVISDKTEAAYARGDLFTKRRALMTAWANYCTMMVPFA